MTLEGENDLRERIVAWAREGFCCAQIMVLAGLAYRGEEDRNLVAAANGLCQGAFSRGNTCGALTGAACLLGLYAGKGEAEDLRDPRLRLMAEELNQWFRETQTGGTGGVRCGDLLGETVREPDPLRCLHLVQHTLTRTLEILQSHGVDLFGASS